MATFKAPNYDTLTESKQDAVNAQLLDYLRSTNPDSAEYVGVLIANLDRKAATETKKPINDDLIRTNKEILNVLKKIEANMVDEQDTSIKKIPIAKAKKSSSNAVTNLSGLPSVQSHDSSGFDPTDLLDFDRDRDNKRSRKGKRGRRGVTDRLKDVLSRKKDTDALKKDVDKNLKDVKNNTKAPKQNTTEKSAQKAIPDAKKAPTKVEGVSKSATKEVTKAVTPVAKSVAKAAAKGVPLAGAALSIGLAAQEFAAANSDEERIDAVASNAGSAAGAAAGAVIGQALIPIPVVGALIGGALGGLIGGAAGEFFGDLLKDPEDAIPDSVKNSGYAAELAYIDNTLIPQIKASNADDAEKKKQIASLDEYKDELKKKIAQEQLPEVKREKLLTRLESQDVIETNFFGSDEILKWDAIAKLPTSDIETLLKHDGWDDQDVRRLEDILSARKAKEGKPTDNAEATVIEDLDAAIAKQTENANLAVASGNKDNAEAAKAQLQKLQEAKAQITGTSVAKSPALPLFSTMPSITPYLGAETYVDSVQVPFSAPSAPSGVPSAAQSTPKMETTFSGNSVTFDPTAKNGDQGFKDAVAAGTSQAGEERCVSAAQYATKAASANSTSTGYCARYVANALEFGGNFKFQRQSSAYMYNGVLPGLGFKAYPASEPAKVGDVIVYGKCAAHRHGHIQIWNGKNWVSDWVQRRGVPYRAGYDPDQTITLYRFSEKTEEEAAKKEGETEVDTKQVSTSESGASPVEGTTEVTSAPEAETSSASAAETVQNTVNETSETATEGFMDTSSIPGVSNLVNAQNRNQKQQMRVQDHHDLEMVDMT